MRELTVGKNDAGQRLDKFITKTLDIPMRLLYKSIRTKKIKVNRKRAEISTKLCEGDTIQCFLAEEFFEKKVTKRSFESITPHLNIVYEDENIMLLNKPAGVSVHEDDKGSTNTLITHVQSYLFGKGEYNHDDEQSFAPALCNRIDRNTSGIVIAAKNAMALRVMNEKIKNREIDKFYLAAVHGIPKPERATVTGFLKKDEKNNTVRVWDKNPGGGAKEIITKYQVIAKGSDTALIEVELLTGRTHQIRAHMAHIGHPLVGDGKYGVNREDRQKGYKYQALCSYKLRFTFDTEREATALDYLDGREFTVPTEEIYFLSEFPDVKI
jgi:23S rRNA pseudouridine955/2504/2580 synthase